MSSEVAISVQHVSKSYPIYRKPSHRLLQAFTDPNHRKFYDEFEALSDVSLEVFRGETVGIVGRNGSGKSTLLQIICGTLSSSHGTVISNGKIAALLELGAGFNGEFSGKENIYMYAAVLGLSDAEIAAKYPEIVAFAEIGDFINQPVKTYSSGMFVRLAFAVAISVDPDILIIDEALSVGDEAFQRKCFGRIEQLKAGGATILFVSHSAGAVVDLCDRAVLLDNGELLLVGEPKHVIASYQKLIYAPPERSEEIRKEIVDIAPSVASVKDESSSDVDLRDHDPTSDMVEFLDEGLVPETSIEYDSRGARISNVRVETIDGRVVNSLVPGRTYYYCYDVDMEAVAQNVRLGMMIRTYTGSELGGCATREGMIEWSHKGQKLTAKISFECLLAPGVYFMNAGVTAKVDGAESFLHRILDAHAIRVLTVPERLVTGFVDFKFAPALSIN